MRRSGRTAGALCALACAAPLLTAAPAHAASAIEAPSAVGWFNAAGPKDTGTPAGTLPNVATNADGVAEDNLGVQGGRGQEQKVAFLRFPAEALFAGGTATRAVVTVPLATGSGNVSAAAAPEKVRACKIDATGFGGEDGADLSVAPARLCEEFETVATASSDGTAYVFDVTALAAGWGEANDGLALTATADAAPFQVVFAPTATLLLEFEPAVEEELPTLPSTPETSSGGGSGTAEVPSASFDGGSGFSGSVDTSGDIPAPLDGFGSGTSSDPVLAAPDLPLTEAPAGDPLAAPEVAPQPVVPAASVRALDVPLTPTLGFWVAGVLLAGLLALVSLVMGDSAVSTTRTRPSRLDQALSARGGAAGSSRLALS